MQEIKYIFYKILCFSIKIRTILTTNISSETKCRLQDGVTAKKKTLLAAWATLAKVLCAVLILRVGTLRVRHSKCHPRHFFTYRADRWRL